MIKPAMSEDFLSTNALENRFFREAANF